MFDVEWPEAQEEIFKAVLKIANYTGFSKDELLNWSVDEYNKALKFILDLERKQAALLFSVEVYQQLISAKPVKKDGSLDQILYDSYQKKSKEIRFLFTGEEGLKEINNNRFFEARGERVVKEYTVEEFRELKKLTYA